MATMVTARNSAITVEEIDNLVRQDLPISPRIFRYAVSSPSHPGMYELGDWLFRRQGGSCVVVRPTTKRTRLLFEEGRRALVARALPKASHEWVLEYVRHAKHTQDRHLAWQGPVLLEVWRLRGLSAELVDSLYEAVDRLTVATELGLYVTLTASKFDAVVDLLHRFQGPVKANGPLQ